MAQNNKQSKLSEKGDECNFTWKVFVSWDYGIANVETAHNKVASITMGFREALVEEFEKEKENAKSWKVKAKRFSANFFVLILLGLTAYAVIKVVDRSTQPEADSSWYRQNEITIVMSLISIIVPNFFDIISLLEDYHPRKAMRWMLARIMALNLLSMYTLIFALFGKTDGMIESLKRMEEMNKAGINFGLDNIPSTFEPPKDCYQIPIPCDVLEKTNLPPMYSLQLENSSVAVLVTPMPMNETMFGYDHCSSCLDKCGSECQDECFSLFDCQPLNGYYNVTDVTNCTECASDLFEESIRTTPVPEINIIMRGDQEEEEISSSTVQVGNCMRKICRRRFFGTKKPPEIEPAVETCQDVKSRYIHELKEKIKLRKLCWETMFGQELVKLTVMDTVFTLLSIIIGDFGRSLILRVLNPCWFWDLEGKIDFENILKAKLTLFSGNFPKYPDFKVAENILHLVNNQGMIWMGLFMAPGLPLINLVKLALMMYARAWAVMTTNVPHETVFRASRSNNFYFVLLLMMLFLCTLPVS